MITHSTSATPRLDWLRANLVLALQELQDVADRAGGIEAVCSPKELSDWDIWSFWVEWDTDSLELSLVPALDSDLKLIHGHERPDSCIRLGYWSRWNPDIVTLESLTVGEVASAVEEWKKLVLGDVTASRVIAMLRHDLIPGDIEYDGLDLELMGLIREIWRCRHNRAWSVFPGDEIVAPLLEAVLSHYLADESAELQLEDSEEVWDIVRWLLCAESHSPRIRSFLEAAAELQAQIGA